MLYEFVRRSLCPLLKKTPNNHYANVSAIYVAIPQDTIENRFKKCVKLYVLT